MSSKSEDQLLQEVEEILLEHKGAENAITSREIAELVGIDEVESFPQTRELIREVLQEQKVPLAASNNGYYVIQNQDELDKYLANLTRRANKIEQRQIDVLRAVEVSEFLDFEEDESDVDLL